MKHDLLLLSNSAMHGRRYLAHARDAIAEFLGGRKTLYFIPFVLKDHAGYTATVQETLGPLGLQIIGLHTMSDPRAALEQAQVVFLKFGHEFGHHVEIKPVNTGRIVRKILRRRFSGKSNFCFNTMNKPEYDFHFLLWRKWG